MEGNVSNNRNVTPIRPEDGPKPTATTPEVPCGGELPPPPPPPDPTPSAPPSEPSPKPNSSGIHGNRTQGPNVNGPVNNIYQVIYEKLEPDGTCQDERKALADFTIELPPHRTLELTLEAEAIEDQLYQLRAERLILISCANDHLAFDGAQALATRLEFEAPTRRRLLNFKRLGREKSEPSIYFLREPATLSDELVIVVDAVGESAKSFLDDVLYTRDSGTTSLRHELAQAKTSIICIVNSEDVSSRLLVRDGSFEEECPFPYWSIPFLRPLLQRHFPIDFEALEARIMEVRERWDRDERTFRFRIETLIKSGKLLEFLNTTAAQDSSTEAQNLLIGDSGLQDHLIFAGIFFPGLNPREFQRIISFLLRDKTTAVTVPSTVRKADGTIEKIEVQEERQMLDIWRKSMDKLQRDCQLITCLVDESQTTIDFKDHRLRPLLRDQLKLEYAFFHTSLFEQMLDCGLLFDPSAPIAENMIELTAGMINLDPEYYGYEWLLKTFSTIEARFGQPQAEPLFAVFTTSDTNHVNQVVYRRSSQLLRKLLEQYQAVDFANGLLERLLQKQLYCSALELIKGLRSVSQLDEFYWLRQLVERGDEPIRILTGLYIRAYLRSIGPRAYPLINGLNSWIKPDPQNESYSPSSLEALQLIFVFCSSIRFDESKALGTHYLFLFPDRETATRDLGILVRHLFHPWMEKAIAELELEIEALVAIAIFIAEWVVAIFGKVSGSITSLQENVGPSVSPAETVRILLEQIVNHSTREQQDELIDTWMVHSELLRAFIIALPYDAQERDAFVMRRNRLDDLLTQFRRLAINKIYTRMV